MGEARINKAKLTLISEGQEPSPDPPKERFCVTVILANGSVEKHEDVVTFGPIPMWVVRRRFIH